MISRSCARKCAQRVAKDLQFQYIGYLMRALESNNVTHMDMRTYKDLFRGEGQGLSNPAWQEGPSSTCGGQDTLGAEPNDLIQVISRSPLRRMPQHTESDEVDDVPLSASTVTAAAGVQRDTESEEMPNVPHPVTGKIKGWPWYNKYVATGPLRAATSRKPRKQKADPSTDVCTNVKRFVKGRAPPGSPATAADLQKRTELQEQGGDELWKQGGEQSPAVGGKEVKGRLTTSSDTSRDELRKQGGEQRSASRGKEALELQSPASRVKELADAVKRLEERIEANLRKDSASSLYVRKTSYDTLRGKLNCRIEDLEHWQKRLLLEGWSEELEYDWAYGAQPNLQFSDDEEWMCL